MDVELETIHEDVFLFDLESLMMSDESFDYLDSFGSVEEENSKKFPAFSFLPLRQNSMTKAKFKKCIRCGKNARSNRVSHCIDEKCGMKFPSGHKTKKKRLKKSKKNKKKIGHKRKKTTPLNVRKLPIEPVWDPSTISMSPSTLNRQVSLDFSEQEKSIEPVWDLSTISMSPCALSRQASFDLSSDDYSMNLLSDDYSMTIDSDPEAHGNKRCWCSEDTCQQKYSRQSKHPRIIEPSSKLRKGGFDTKVQIRIPKELQSHISYGSCKHAYRALVTLITYVQLNCDFKEKSHVYQTFRAPSREKYEHARRVIKGFGLIDDFYVSIWAPTFQCRFIAACGGIGRVQNCIRDFFASSFVQKQKVTQEVTHEVDDFKSECLRIQKILSDHMMDDIRKMSWCAGILYEAIKNPIKI